MKQFFVVMLCLALVACTTQAPAPQAQPPPQVQAPAAEPVAQIPTQQEQPAPVVSAPQKITIPQILSDLLAKRSSVKSIQYDYTATDEAQQYAVWIRGTKVKIGAATAQTLSHEGQFFSHVYFDTASHTVKALCDSPNLCSQTTEKGSFTVPYDEYYRKTPLDWALALEQGLYSPIESDASEVLIDNRITEVFRYDEGNKKTRFYIDKFYGVPLKVETVSDDPAGSKRKFVLYKNAAFNSLIEADVTPKA